MTGKPAMTDDEGAGVRAKVPVEGVHFVQRKEVDVLLHELLGHEMPRDVQVHAAPLEARSVHDRYQRNAPGDAVEACRTEDLSGQQLADRLRRVKGASGCGCRDRDRVRGNRHPITLATKARVSRARATNDDAAAARRGADTNDEVVSRGG